MSLVDVLADCVFDIKPWPLLGEKYWMAQRYVITPAGERLTSIRVLPEGWVAPLIQGAPILHKGMMVYWPVGVCREIQELYDQWVGERR